MITDTDARPPRDIQEYFAELGNRWSAIYAAVSFIELIERSDVGWERYLVWSKDQKATAATAPKESVELAEAPVFDSFGS